jgi:hypothetical protein
MIGDRVRKLAEKVVNTAKAGERKAGAAVQTAEDTIRNAAAEVKKHAMPTGLPAGFKDAVLSVPDFAVEVVHGALDANLSAKMGQALVGVGEAGWTKALQSIQADSALQNNWRLAQAGDAQAQEATDSTLVKILKTVGVVGDAGMGAGTVLLGIGLAALAAGAAGAPITLGGSELPGAAIFLTGLVIFVAAGLLWLLANLLLAWLG